MLSASSGLAAAGCKRAACIKPFGVVRPSRLMHRSRVITPVRASAEVVVEPTADDAPASTFVAPAKFSAANLVQSFEADMKRTTTPLEIGDQVVIDFLVIEKSSGPARDKMGNLLKSSAAQKAKERIQKCAGTIIARRGAGTNQTYTLRRVFQGIGLEIVFPIHSPQVKSIVVVKHSKVRRAKLHFLRMKIGKKARLQTRVEKRVTAESKK